MTLFLSPLLASCSLLRLVPMFAVVPRNELPKLYSVCKRRNYKVGRVGSPLNNV